MFGVDVLTRETEDLARICEIRSIYIMKLLAERTSHWQFFFLFVLSHSSKSKPNQKDSTNAPGPRSCSMHATTPSPPVDHIRRATISDLRYPEREDRNEMCYLPCTYRWLVDRSLWALGCAGGGDEQRGWGTVPPRSWRTKQRWAI